jgi:glycosyltransferase involved in cell wall biosynthesis
MSKKKKVLMLSDHALSTSGVGIQSRFLIEGLLQKGEWSFRQFGAAIKHDNYETVVVNDDFIIKPIDGFGDRELLRVTLATEKPDVLLIFTDPRFFIWLFEMEDEIHQVCPIVWWHVWDNRPAPDFNNVLYEATDLINCHSYLTYEMCKEKFPERTNFVPHAYPPELYYPLSPQVQKTKKAEILGPHRANDFVVLWVNRNAKRKRPNDVLWAWKLFLEALQEKHHKTDAVLLMHTDPQDNEGPNLMAAAEHLGLKDKVIFSADRVDFAQMNILHNISDVCLNVSFAEGFGLATLESMLCGKPIIAAKTGGLTRQVVDHRDGSENGAALDVEFQTLVGSQAVPYIYEDYVSAPTVAAAIMQMYELGPKGRSSLGKKAREYALSEFSFQKTIDLWHETMNETISTWKNKYKRIVCRTL